MMIASRIEGTKESLRQTRLSLRRALASMPSPARRRMTTRAMLRRALAHSREMSLAMSIAFTFFRMNPAASIPVGGVGGVRGKSKGGGGEAEGDGGGRGGSKKF